jgi:hypothetical protein
MAYATNAHMAIRIPIDNWFFSEKDAASLEGKKISTDQFKLIFGKHIIIGPGEILIADLNVTVKLSDSEMDKSGKLYVAGKLDEYFDNKDEPTPLNHISFNAKYVDAISKCLGEDKLLFNFKGTSKGIIITSNNSGHPGEGLIMPIEVE